MQGSYQNPACETLGFCSPTSMMRFKDAFGIHLDQVLSSPMYKPMEIMLLKAENTRYCTNVKFYCDFECF